MTRSEYSRLRSEFRDVDEDNSVGRGNWYLGHKGAKMPSTLKWSTTKEAQRSRMNKVHGPKDSIGTMLGSTLVNNMFDEMDTVADRWSSGGSTPSYSYGGNTYNRGGYIANPSRGAIERANRAGALTRREYSRLKRL